MNIRTRIVIVFLAIGILGFLYLLHRVDEEVRPVYLQSIEEDLVDTATTLSSLVAVSGGRALDTTRLGEVLEHAANRDLKVSIYDRVKTGLELRVYVANQQGVIVYDSRENSAVGQNYRRWNDVSRTLKGKYGARATWEKGGDSRILVLYVASPIVVDGEIIGTVTVGKPTPVAYSFFQKVRREAFQGLALAAFLGILWTLAITAWITRPIRRLTEYAVTVRDGGHAELPPLGRSDIGLLGNAFEEMRDALEGKKYVEQYVQTLTHEIKSPLSAIRGAAELIDEQMPADRRASFLKNIRTETERIQRIVDRLLELSSLESRKGLRNLEEIDLGGMITEILNSMAPLAENREVSVIFEAENGFSIRGERFLIHLALSNLVQNALGFTPRGGTVDIRCEDRSVKILDTGPGIPDYAIERVFDRFYSLQRPDSGKKSSGLGLSIVQRVAQLHQATVTLGNRKDTRGAEATFTFAD